MPTFYDLFTPERMAILKALTDAGIIWKAQKIQVAPPEPSFPEGTWSYVLIVEGFYKSGEITLAPVTIPGKAELFIAHSRYGQDDRIFALEDLVLLNFDWWQKSKDRFEGWAQPDPKWAPLMLTQGLLVAREIPATTVYEPK